MRAVPSLPGYWADATGIVYRGDSPVPCHTHEAGYFRFREGTKLYYVHRVVCETWHGPCPEGHECLHSDGNPRNNHPENLRWGTRKANVFDMARHGTSQHGERGSNAKLTWEDVDAIRAAVAAGESRRTLAERYGRSYYTVCDIISVRTWDPRFRDGDGDLDFEDQTFDDLVHWELCRG